MEGARRPGRRGRHRRLAAVSALQVLRPAQCRRGLSVEDYSLARSRKGSLFCQIINLSEEKGSSLLFFTLCLLVEDTCITEVLPPDLITSFLTTNHGKHPSLNASS